MATKHTSLKRTNRKFGQGMTEYVIIVVLVAIAVLGAVRLFGETVRDKFGVGKDGKETSGGTIDKIKNMDNAKKP